MSIGSPHSDRSLSRARGELSWRDRVVALALCALYVLALFKTQDMGFTRDESFYFHAATQYEGWFRELGDNWEQGRVLASFQQESIDRHWSYNPEHPILVKTSFALSGLLFHDTLQWMTPSEAFRFPAMLFAGALIAVMYLFATEVTGRRSTALIAVVFFASMPRWFFHAHLTCFDVPITFMWVLFIYAYWKSLDSNRWAWTAGFFWGLCLITKLNAFFLPFVLLAHWAVVWGTRIQILPRGILQAPYVPKALFTMLIGGPLIFYFGWPRHWYDTWNRVAWYFRFHMHHDYYFVDYFGQNLWRPPFPIEYPFVLTAITTPVAVLLAFVLGASLLVGQWLVRVRKFGLHSGDAFGTGVLFFWNIFIPFAVIAAPSSPIFGGIKHWFPALPFMMILAAAGLQRMVELVVESLPSRAPVALAVASLLSFPSFYAISRDHEYSISYYNELLGGYTGGADHQMMRQYWGYASRGLLDWLNTNAPPNASVHFSDTTGGAVDMYKSEGWLREDIRATWSVRSADFVMFDVQKALQSTEFEAWDEFGTQSPATVLSVAGVPVITVYARHPVVPQTERAAADGPASDDDAAQDSGAPPGAEAPPEAATVEAPAPGTL